MSQFSDYFVDKTNNVQMPYIHKHLAPLTSDIGDTRTQNKPNLIITPLSTPNVNRATISYTPFYSQHVPTPSAPPLNLLEGPFISSAGLTPSAPPLESPSESPKEPLHFFLNSDNKEYESITEKEYNIYIELETDTTKPQNSDTDSSKRKKDVIQSEINNLDLLIKEAESKKKYYAKKFSGSGYNIPDITNETCGEQTKKYVDLLKKLTKYKINNDEQELKNLDTTIKELNINKNNIDFNKIEAYIYYGEEYCEVNNDIKMYTSHKQMYQNRLNEN